MKNKTLTLIKITHSANLPKTPDSVQDHFSGLSDDEEAQFWLAAEQGVMQAGFNIGVMYMEGKGVIFDTGQAFKWFEKAAAQEHATARMILKMIEYRKRLR